MWDKFHNGVAFLGRGTRAAILLDFAEYPVIAEDIDFGVDIFDRMSNKLPVDVISTGIRMAIIQNGEGMPLLCA